jgi:hypothetical protein
MAKTPKNQKVASFDTNNVREILAACEAALGPIAERYGLTLTQKGRCGFHRTDFQLPFGLMVATQETTDADPRDAEIITAFVKHATMFGMQPHWLGKSFDNPRHGRVTVVGLAPKSRKWPVIIETAKGTRFKFSEQDVIAALSPNEAAKVAPGTKVVWKHEYEHRGQAAGPAWLRGADGSSAVLKETNKGIEAIPEDMSDVNPDGTRPFKRDAVRPDWISQASAKRYAAQIGAAFVES